MNPIDREPDDMLQIARLEERRIATAVSALADAAEPMAGGVLARAAPGTWLNACYGAGVDVEIDRAMLQRVIEFYVPHGIEPRLELIPFLSAQTLAALADLGFVVRGYDNILYRRTEGVAAPEDSALPQGVMIERVDIDDDDAVDRFARAALSGFAAGTGDVAEPSLDSMRRAMRLPGTLAIVARYAHEIIGAAAMETVGVVSCFFGASVAPPMRGRGIQRALLQYRLHAAADMGARYATIGSRPGATTERNVRRLGFTLAYMRTAFVRPAVGLRPIVE